jgi:anti-anti-sigma factor
VDVFHQPPAPRERVTPREDGALLCRIGRRPSKTPARPRLLLHAPRRGRHNATVELLKVVPAGEPGTLRLVGELDVSNVDEVKGRLEEELRLGSRLSLDASELSFLDSQGLRMLIELGAMAVTEGWVIRLVNRSQEVRRVLDLSVPGGIPGIEVLPTGT